MRPSNVVVQPLLTLVTSVIASVGLVRCPWFPVGTQEFGKVPTVPLDENSKIKFTKKRNAMRSLYNNFFNDDFFERSFTSVLDKKYYPRHWLTENRFQRDWFNSDEDTSEDEIMEPPKKQTRRIQIKTTSPQTPTTHKTQEQKVEEEPAKEPEDFDPYVEWEDQQLRDDVPYVSVEPIWTSTKRGNAVTIGGVPVNNDSIRTLKGNNWLDDGVINAYMSLLYSESLERDQQLYFFAPCSTLFFEVLTSPKYEGDESTYNYKRVSKWTKKIDLLSMDKIIVPIHVAGSHWTVACINIRDRQFEYYDSLIALCGHKEYGQYVLDRLCRYLEDEAKDKQQSTLHANRWRRFVYNEKEIPQQDNSYDCGVFVCLFARNIAQDKRMNFSQVDIQQHRKLLALSILNKRVCNI
jgi:Ulp1 family protease